MSKFQSSKVYRFYSFSVSLLQDGETFEFKELFKAKVTEEEKTMQDMRRNNLDSERAVRRDWSRLDLPPWFR